MPACTCLPACLPACWQDILACRSEGRGRNRDARCGWAWGFGPKVLSWRSRGRHRGGGGGGWILRQSPPSALSAGAPTFPQPTHCAGCRPACCRVSCCAPQHWGPNPNPNHPPTMTHSAGSRPACCCVSCCAPQHWGPNPNPNHHNHDALRRFAAGLLPRELLRATALVPQPQPPQPQRTPQVCGRPAAA